MRIDAHVHFIGEHPEAIALLEELDLKAHNVCVAANHRGSWRQRQQQFRDLAKTAPLRYAWTTTFDPPGFDDPSYVERVIEGLSRDFADGALACKIWKNIGLEVRRPTGEPFMVDDPLWTPILEWLENQGRTLIMHLADPIKLWQQPGGLPAGTPSQAEILAAGERVIARHGRLRIIGAHIGSQDHDLAAVAKRLDAYPNYAIDTAARLSYLAHHDSGEVRDLFLRCPDRILWGTDIVKTVGRDMPAAERKPLLDRLREIYRHAFLYYESCDEVPVHERGFSVRGLALPPGVLEQFYCTNAKRWIPGL